MRLRIGIGRYDRTQALLDGRVTVKGYDASIESPPLEELFAKAFDHGEYEVAELSFSNYLYLTSERQCRYVGLPIFPSRMFRHSAIFIRTDRGIRTPRDLAGKVVGVREFSMTAALVARGVLEDEYGVAAASIRWRDGPGDAYDSKPIIRMRPRGINFASIDEGQNLSDLLREGKLDAVVAYKPPKCFTEGAPNVARLFPDHEAVERDYFARTGIFPIMHLVGIRRDLAADSALCLAVCEAFQRAKREALEALTMYQALSIAMPWAPADVRRVQALMGPDYWPYGVGANRAAIEAIARYSFSQGLASRALSVEELFAPPVLSWVPEGGAK
jgi:4,5-dihydroxyphthalate decarboxylase